LDQVRLCDGCSVKLYFHKLKNKKKDDLDIASENKEVKSKEVKNKEAKNRDKEEISRRPS
jgi:hypothetical protein